MKYTPAHKKLLVEVDTNPLASNDVDLSYDEKYKQAIIKAAASECSAIVEYQQILALEDKVSTTSLVNLFHDTLEDLTREETKHLAQLTAKISEVPEMKDAYEAGTEEAEKGVDQDDKSEDKNEKEETSDDEHKESMTEAVLTNRAYNADEICQIIGNYLDLDNNSYFEVENFFWNTDNELSPEQVDAGLVKVASRFDLSPEQVDELENMIIQSSDPIQSRKDDFRSDIDSDISTLESLIDENKLYSVAAKNRIISVINELRNLDYDGDKDTGWRQDQSIYGGSNPTKRMIG